MKTLSIGCNLHLKSILENTTKRRSKQAKHLETLARLENDLRVKTLEASQKYGDVETKMKENLNLVEYNSQIREFV